MKRLFYPSLIVFDEAFITLKSVTLTHCLVLTRLFAFILRVIMRDLWIEYTLAKYGIEI